MSITLTQGILLAVVAFICGLDGAMEVFFWFRPIVVSFFTGIVLGDMNLGLQCGAVAELAYMGMMTVGGTVPPNPLMAGIMTVVIAYTNNVEPSTALGLSLPFALLAQWFGILFNTSFALFLGPLDRAAAKADVKKFTSILFGAWFIVAGTYAILVFVSSYALQEPIQLFVESFPEKLIHGFEVAGGLMPAVGLTLLMVVMLKQGNMAYLFIGFIIATFNGLLEGAFEAAGGGYGANIIPVAIAGACFAYFTYITEQRSIVKEGGTDDGI